MAILNNMKYIWKVSFAILIMVVSSTIATGVASAETSGYISAEGELRKYSDNSLFSEWSYSDNSGVNLSNTYNNYPNYKSLTFNVDSESILEMFDFERAETKCFNYSFRLQIARRDSNWYERLEVYSTYWQAEHEGFNVDLISDITKPTNSSNTFSLSMNVRVTALSDSYLSNIDNMTFINTATDYVTYNPFYVSNSENRAYNTTMSVDTYVFNGVDPSPKVVQIECSSIEWGSEPEVPSEEPEEPIEVDSNIVSHLTYIEQLLVSICIFVIFGVLYRVFVDMFRR